MADSTILERVRDNPDELLYKSERHRVFAAIDTYPRLPYQCIVAPFDGTPGEVAHFNTQRLIIKRKLFEVADFVGKKMLKLCSETQRVITHIEGYGINDHPHIVLFAAERKQGVDLYTGDSLGLVAVQSSIEAMTFTDSDRAILDARLNDVDRSR